MPLCLVPEILDPIDVIFLFGEFFGMIDANMVEFSNIQNIVRSKTVGINNAVGLNTISDNA